jgi:lysophospholipase L1-like esterase
MRRLIVGVLASLLLAAGAASSQDKPVQADKIILVGDSTTAVGSGWGGAFCDRHVLSALACVNLGRQGRSTWTYRAEGSWDLALNEMATPGYQSVWVLIQFGHNDQPGKRSSTDLATQFPANLRAYVAEARARGARPILLTPLTRRHFKDGQLQNTLVPLGRRHSRRGLRDKHASDRPERQQRRTGPAPRRVGGRAPVARRPAVRLCACPAGRKHAADATRCDAARDHAWPPCR